MQPRLPGCRNQAISPACALCSPFSELSSWREIRLKTAMPVYNEPLFAYLGMAVKRRGILVVVSVIIVSVAVATPGVLIGPGIYLALWRGFVVGPKHRPLRNVTFAQSPQQLARGAYLVRGPLACFRCHSDRDWSQPGAPPIHGREGAGHDFSDEGRPWLVAPNLTSDPETGIGRSCFGGGLSPLIATNS